MYCEMKSLSVQPAMCASQCERSTNSGETPVFQSRVPLVSPPPWIMTMPGHTPLDVGAGPHRSPWSGIGHPAGVYVTVPQPECVAWDASFGVVPRQSEPAGEETANAAVG